MKSVSPVDLDALVNFFESITPDTVAQLGHFYDSQARFVDPFIPKTEDPGNRHNIFDPFGRDNPKLVPHAHAEIGRK